MSYVLESVDEYHYYKNTHLDYDMSMEIKRGKRYISRSGTALRKEMSMASKILVTLGDEKVTVIDVSPYQAYVWLGWCYVGIGWYKGDFFERGWITASDIVEV